MARTPTEVIVETLVHSGVKRVYGTSGRFSERNHTVDPDQQPNRVDFDRTQNIQEGQRGATQQLSVAS
jgi:hypothetical protein